METVQMRHLEAHKFHRTGGWAVSALFGAGHSPGTLVWRLQWGHCWLQGWGRVPWARPDPSLSEPHETHATRTQGHFWPAAHCCPLSPRGLHKPGSLSVPVHRGERRRSHSVGRSCRLELGVTWTCPLVATLHNFLLLKNFKLQDSQKK
jgi:hypothetical protein